MHAQAAKLGLRVRTYRDENGEEMLKAGSPTAATGGKEEELYEHNVLMMYMGIYGYPFNPFLCLLCRHLHLFDVFQRSTWNRMFLKRWSVVKSASRSLSRPVSPNGLLADSSMFQP